MRHRTPAPFQERVEMLIPPLPWDRQAHRGPETGAEKVVLLHGLGRSWRAMNPLARKLQQAGFSTLNLPYPSLVKPLDWILDHVDAQVAGFAEGGRVHFVTHSLGGIVTRMLLEREHHWAAGRLVMMAPPSSGSEIIDWASRRVMFRPFLSSAARALASDALQARLAGLRQDQEALVIMGNRSSIPFFRRLLDEDNDGIVSSNRGRVDGLKGFSVVDADHTFIQIHPEAVRQTIDFLREGRCPGTLSGESAVS
ncbi:alpha/beta fold hydrolase [Luteolibacter sp. SL250]|uniref:alpha/beta fold hydrolase n=1 Tax=Luteolibacter sp. SL250 TaxID=2995170 RepID=UPI00226FBE8E|nr:alpha/beta fold hydrolase [Luteolibacter sp. SL250]WAC18672.1 alpha/beta fold hydrolase [Luteolibacter sp. SL250]